MTVWRLLLPAVMAPLLALSARADLARPVVAPQPRLLVPADDADDALDHAVRQVEGTSPPAGAWLDLAVVLCQRGHTGESNAVLTYVESAFDPPEGIRELISVLRASRCERPEKRVRLTLSVQRGYEDNVNQGASNPLFELGSAFPGVVLPLAPEFLPRGDRYLSGDASLVWGRDDGIRFTALLREKRYDSVSAYSLRTFALGADREWNCGFYRCALSSALGSVELGGSPYQTFATLQGSWAAAPAYLTGVLGVEAGVTRQLYTSQPNLDAWLGLTKASWRFAAPTGDHLQLSAGFGADVPSRDRPGGRRLMALLSAAGAREIVPNYRLDWSLQAQKSRDSEPYSPGLIDAVRKPLLQVASFAVSRPVARGQELRVEYRATANHDSVSLFSYRVNALSVGWQWRGDF